MARYYSQYNGSFWSPDPGGASAYSPSPGWFGTVDRHNPLSWNRYMYGLGDPINKVDPTGAIACDPGDDDGCDPADYDDDCGDVLCTCDDGECTNEGGDGGGLSNCGTEVTNGAITCTSDTVTVVASPIDPPTTYPSATTSRLVGGSSGVITINPGPYKPVVSGSVITTPAPQPTPNLWLCMTPWGREINTFLLGGAPSDPKAGNPPGAIAFGPGIFGGSRGIAKPITNPAPGTAVGGLVGIIGEGIDQGACAQAVKSRQK